VGARKALEPYIERPSIVLPRPQSVPGSAERGSSARVTVGSPSARHRVVGTVSSLRCRTRCADNQGADPLPEDYILECLLNCGICNREMGPTRNIKGTRSYACWPNCPQPDVRAIPVEQDLLFRAMVRAYAVLYGVSKPSTVTFDGPGPEFWQASDRFSITHNEVRRWQQSDPSDHKGMLRSAYVRVVIDAEGTVHPLWRHKADVQASGALPER